MAWTQKDIDRLKKQLAIKQTMDGGRMTTTEDFEDKLKLLAMMESEVNGKPSRQFVEYVGFSRCDG